MVAVGNLRAGPGERPDDHLDRLVEQLRGTGARFAWLCVSPGPHVPLLARAAIEAGLHLMAEKPWRYANQTPVLRRLAEARGVLVGVDFEYCLLLGVDRWRDSLSGGDGLRFGGTFTVPGPDRLGIPAIDNLGSHLLAIREFAVPRSKLGNLECGYGRTPVRVVWVEDDDRRAAEVDFTAGGEPVLQRVLHGFESATRDGDFPLDLAFAERVATAIAEVDVGPGS